MSAAFSGNTRVVMWPVAGRSHPQQHLCVLPVGPPHLNAREETLVRGGRIGDLLPGLGRQPELTGFHQLLENRDGKTG